MMLIRAAAMFPTGSRGYGYHRGGLARQNQMAAHYLSTFYTRLSEPSITEYDILRGVMYFERQQGTPVGPENKPFAKISNDELPALLFIRCSQTVLSTTNLFQRKLCCKVKDTFSMWFFLSRICLYLFLFVLVCFGLFCFVWGVCLFVLFCLFFFGGGGGGWWLRPLYTLLVISQTHITVLSTMYLV